jgi:hypothetical protein
VHVKVFSGNDVMSEATLFNTRKNVPLSYNSQVLKQWGAPPPPGGAVDPQGWRGYICTRNIFILNEIWAHYKIYISVGTLLG